MKRSPQWGDERSRDKTHFIKRLFGFLGGGGNSIVGLNIGANSFQLALLSKNKRANAELGRATERLSTGRRINRGSDDPAGLIGAEQLRGDLVEIRAQNLANSTRQLQTNVQQQGRQIAANVLREIRGLIIEVKGSSSGEQREAIQRLIDFSLDAINQLGSVSGFTVPTELESLRLGGENSVVEGYMSEAVELIEEQLTTINQASAAAGAYQKYTLVIEPLLAQDQAVIIAEAMSQQEDADYAEESSDLLKSLIITVASTKTIALARRLQLEANTLLLDTLQ